MTTISAHIGLIQEKCPVCGHMVKLIYEDPSPSGRKKLVLEPHRTVEQLAMGTGPCAGSNRSIPPRDGKTEVI